MQINKLKEQAKERVELAKALIRASEKKGGKNPEKAKAVDGDDSAKKTKNKKG